MSMQNLNQIRARHVLDFAHQHKKLDPTSHTYKTTIEGVNGGEVVKNIPSAVMNNGILAAIAYAMDDKNKGCKGWSSVFSGVAQHLASEEIGIVDPQCATAEDLLDFLVGDNSSSNTLREATDETMAWLEYARRLIQ